MPQLLQIAGHASFEHGELGLKPKALCSHGPQIDFSLFSRLSFFGAMLNDQGTLELDEKLAKLGHQLSHDAQIHGTQVDLVMHRSDWGPLLAREDQDLARTAEVADSTPEAPSAETRSKWPTAARPLPAVRAASPCL